MSDLQFKVFMDDADVSAELRADVKNGLSATPRWLSPRWFYDERGSELFDQITKVPEYYLTNAETEILESVSDEIAEIVGSATLVELGSGFSTKTKLILDAFSRQNQLGGIYTFDVSQSALRAAGEELGERYPSAELRAIVGDYGRHLAHVPPPVEGSSRLLVFLGSTIGNLIPNERRAFLAECARMLSPGEYFLIGADLVKDGATLDAAYNDSADLNAEFNLNILNVLINQLDADIDTSAFVHEAAWQPEFSWVQIALRAKQDTEIIVPDLVTTSMKEGERILTEVSTKFTPEGFDTELEQAGFRTSKRWFDAKHQFMLTLAQRH